MSAYPDLLRCGYKIESELGRNREGGRITWKGVNLTTQEPVVIKQFRFAQANSSWSGYKAYAQEIKVLQTLKHPRIPQYLDSIETEDGFCLIQEYIAAVNSSAYRTLTLSEVKQIAVDILDILVYLQQQSPPIIHRDLQPENILLDESLHAYLIDFGFSSLGSQEISSSSFFKGTPGFIAPEQIIQPTVASDIYSLGITLVYLLTDKDLEKIRASASADDPYQLSLKSLLPDLEGQFFGWLKKMTNAKISQRFPDALTARDALAKLDLPGSAPSRAISTQLNLLVEPKIIVGTLAISGLTTIAVWMINFAYIRVELSIINIAIAILAVAAISVAQLSAAAILRSDQRARLQGAALSIIIPAILVSASGIIWGIEEAVISSIAIAITEIFILSYCWWQIPAWKSGSIVRTSSWLSAITLGIILGLRLI